MNPLSTRSINLAIESARYGLSGPVFARIQPLAESASPRWVRIYHARNQGGDHYGQELSTGLWHKIYDWEAR